MNGLMKMFLKLETNYTTIAILTIDLGILKLI